MTNKSIRDYINLIEDAQREGVAEGSKEKGMAAYRKGAHDAHNDKEETNPYPSGTYDYNSYKSGYRTGLAHKDKQQGVAEGSGEYCDACDRVITKKPHVCPGTHGVSEEQLEETSPEAIAKINQITRK